MKKLIYLEDAINVAVSYIKEWNACQIKFHKREIERDSMSCHPYSWKLYDARTVYMQYTPGNQIRVAVSYTVLVNGTIFAVWRKEGKMDDMIIRQAAIDAVCKVCDVVQDYHKCNGYAEDSTWCEFSVALRKLPPVQPERTGYWVIDRELSKQYSDDIFECSACNNNDAWGSTECTRYCSYCGAKMLGIIKGAEENTVRWKT